MQIHHGKPHPLPSQNRRAAAHIASRHPGGRANIIGMAVFAAGLIAVLVMGFWAYTVLYMPDSVGTREEGVPEQQASSLPAQDEAALTGVGAASAPASDSVFHGVWEAPFTGGESAAISFDQGRYQMVLATEPGTARRYYASGQYVYDPAAGTATLKPDYNVPVAPEGLVYESLTRREYKILISFNPEAGRLFLAPSVVEGVNDQIHPLFYHVDSGLGPTGWTQRGAAPVIPAAEASP